MRIVLSSFCILLSLSVLPITAQAQGWGGAPSTTAAPAAPKVSAEAKEAAVKSLKDLEAAQRTVSDIWTTMPLSARRVIFVKESPDTYGVYSERASNVFKAGEKLITYVEPVGYAWKANGDSFDFGLIADFVLKTKDGKVLGGQEKLLTVNKTSHYKNQELMIVLTLTVTGLDPGQYAVDYKLKDYNSDKSAVISQAFTIAD